MAWPITKNLAQSSLASGYTAGNSSITVQTGDGSKFDAPGAGNTIALAIGNPPQFFLRATAVSSDTFTVDTGGFDGSTAVSVVSGTAVTQVITAQVLRELLAATNGYTVPPLTGWTWDSQGGATDDETSGSSVFLNMPTGSSTLRFFYRTAPSTPYSIEVALISDFATGDIALDFGFRDSAGKLIVWHLSNNGTSYVFKFNSSTSATGAYNSFGSSLIYLNPKWLKITDDGTNLIWSYKLGPEDNWVDFVTEPRTDFMTSGPNAVGFGGYVNGGGVRGSLVSWKQG